MVDALEDMISFSAMASKHPDNVRLLDGSLVIIPDHLITADHVMWTDGIKSRRLELTDARLAHFSAGINDWECELCKTDNAERYHNVAGKTYCSDCSFQCDDCGKTSFGFDESNCVDIQADRHVCGSCFANYDADAIALQAETHISRIVPLSNPSNPPTSQGGIVPHPLTHLQ
jgi:hypothetical protein